MNASIGVLAASLLLAAAMLGLYLRERQRRLQLGFKLEQAAQQMSTHLEHDPLTGLLTRSGLDIVLEKAVQKVDSSGGAFCVLYVALDNFGLLNDAFGQSIGDRLLKEVAERLTRCAELSTEACRITAGEFALIVNGGLAIGRSAAKNVTAALAEPFRFEAIQTQVSCSIGIASYPEHGSRAKLLGNAALAMRSVKLNGGGDFCQYDLKMGLEVREQAVMVNDLR
ncbi:MAG: GGDEF domain-containing protein, partial [Comamonadaceae bacterium]